MNALSAVSFPAAFAAGLLSFLSPCILPVIPGYLSFISGRSMEDLGSGSERGAVLFRTAFFVAGFALVFSVLGLVFSGSALLTNAALAQTVTIIAGSVIILFGLNLIFDFLSFLNRELKTHVSKKPSSAAGALLVGMAFGAGWTPCIGPMLASILLLASQSGSATRALLLLLTYSLGLGLPFMLTAYFFPRLGPVLRWMKEHRKQIRIASGLMLIGLGLLMLAGRLTWINTNAIRFGWLLRDWTETAPLTLRLVFSAFWFILLALAIVVPLAKRKTIKNPGRITLISILSLLFLLEAGGLASSAQILANWLLFQGV